MGAERTGSWSPGDPEENRHHGQRYRVLRAPCLPGQWRHQPVGILDDEPIYGGDNHEEGEQWHVEHW